MAPISKKPAGNTVRPGGKTLKRFSEQVKSILVLSVFQLEKAEKKRACRLMPEETAELSRTCRDMLMRFFVLQCAEHCAIELPVDSRFPALDDATRLLLRDDFETILSDLVPESPFHRILVAERIGQVYEELLEYDILRRNRGGFDIVRGSGRRSTGAHYTSRDLAENVVRSALEPVIYESPSNGKTIDGRRLKSPEEILSLKICDPAMGCGAFLVECCRQLAGALLESLNRAPATGEQVVDAMRLVAERCLYGVDIDPAAVELGKLSLLLVTTGKNEVPAGFGKRLRRGDSLLGACRIDDTGRSSRNAFRWKTEFPDVFNRPDGNGGFDAVLGNPPFLGGRKMRATLGEDYLRELKTAWPHASWNADLCSYFFLAASKLLRRNGSACFLATNTIAQGDTARTGLRFLVDREGFSIREADASIPWPGKATVVVSRVAIVKGSWPGGYRLNGKRVAHITPVLDDGDPWGDIGAYPENAAIRFQGSVLAGRGFLLTPEEAKRYVEADEKNREVVFRFLGGNDLKSSPTYEASRWVVDFRDHSLDRCETDWPELLEWIRRRVKPQRDRARRASHRRFWWMHGDKRPALYGRIRNKEFVFAIVRHAKHFALARVPTDQVFQESLCLLDLPDWAAFASVQSTIHAIWAHRGSSTLGNGLRYTPSDYFDTFPMSHLRSETLDTLGRKYYEFRQKIMLDEGIGLTEAYNRFHNPKNGDSRIDEFRERRRRLDEGILSAHGWNDLIPDHDFRPVEYLPTSDNVRFMIGEKNRREILRRLTQLNREQTGG